MSKAPKFSKDFDIVHGQADQLSPLIRRIVANNVSAFTFKGTCTYIVGKGDVVVIDPGPNDPDHISAILRATEGENITHILLTHTHKDHCGGLALLKQHCDAQTFAFQRDLSIDLDRKISESGLDASIDKDFIPDIALGHGSIIDGPDCTFECLHTPGHLDDHLCFMLKEENVLFSGDHVMTWSTSVVAPPDGNMADYLNSLKLLVDRDETKYWPGHGGGVEKPQQFVRALITHRKMREAAILDRIRKGDHTIADMIPHIYEGLDPRLVPAASLSVLAHMEDLVTRGALGTDGPLSRESIFHLV